MTYLNEMPTIRKFCPTYALLFRWQGSIYKLLWKEVLIYFICYICLGMLYRFVLDEHSQSIFEMVAACCDKYANSIPVVLMLGFFTGTVMQRWWAVYNTIPGTGKIITLATFYMNKDHSDVSKWLRTLTRYIVLAWMLGMRTTCQPLRKKFPDLEAIEDAGFLLRHEKEILYRVEAQEGSSKMCLQVINWAMLLVREGRDNGYFVNPNDAPRLLDPILAFKKSCSNVLKYQSTPIPLSFIQAVTLTVNIFAIVSLMGKQFVDLKTKLMVIDCFLPILPAMQYLAYLAWLKLGEVSVNPFGEDDDDFDIIGLFDNHVKTASDILNLFETSLSNPTKESLEMTEETLFKEVLAVPVVDTEALQKKENRKSEQFKFMDEPNDNDAMICGSPSSEVCDQIKMGIYGI